MKNLLLFSLLIFSSLSFSKECECWKFKTGTFYIPPNGKLDTLIVNRDEQFQYEYFVGEPDDVHKLRVIWLGDCKFILRTTKYQKSNTTKFLVTDVMVKIIATFGDDHFRVKTWAKKGKKKWIFDMYRIKEED